MDNPAIYDLMVAWGRMAQVRITAAGSYGINPIAVMMRYGVPIGPAHYGTEPDAMDDIDRIDGIMEDLRQTDHPLWASLYARHTWRVPGRDMLGVWKDGKIRPLTMREIAEELADSLGEPKSSARQRLYDRCNRGYEIVDRRLKLAA